MIWHYNCPNCGEPTSVDWERHKKETICLKCRRTHYPPTPDEDPYAYIGGAKWPPEMERVVVARKGSVCAVPGCFASYNTLTFRKPLTEGGKICVDNLIPVCTKHALEKGERDYDQWVRELEEKQAAGAIEAILPSAEAEERFAGIPEEEAAPKYVQPITTGYGVKLTPLTGNQPIVIAPFLRGAVRRVFFDYGWEVKDKAEVQLFLLAWSKGEEPNLELLGTEEFKGLMARKEHRATENSRGNDCLILHLPATPAGRWVAAVVAVGEGSFTISEFVLAGTD
ncbi:MAG: hypothetical protein ABIK18_04170 [candidate division WOR-3 bacterium]